MSGAASDTALIGENGAGKSTLIKVLTGVYQADPGAVMHIEGQRVEHATYLTRCGTASSPSIRIFRCFRRCP